MSPPRQLDIISNYYDIVNITKNQLREIIERLCADPDCISTGRYYGPTIDGLVELNNNNKNIITDMINNNNNIYYGGTNANNSIVILYKYEFVDITDRRCGTSCYSDPHAPFSITHLNFPPFEN